MSLVDTNPEEPPKGYTTFLMTVRLYAGWLLAWYFLIYALGFYGELQSLPFRMSMVEQLFLSPIIFLFSFAAYLFLFLTSLHKFLGGGFVKGLLSFVVGVILLVLFYQNM